MYTFVYAFSFVTVALVSEQQGREKMNPTIMEARGVDTSTTVESSTVYSYDSQLYVNNPTEDLQQLRQNKLIQDFANVKPETYCLIASTNPILKMMIDLAKLIMAVE